MPAKVFSLSLVFLLALTAAYIYMSRLENEARDLPPIEETASLLVVLASRDASGEAGTAHFTETPGGLTRVKLSLSGAPENISQPAHIHTGNCASLGPVKYPLTSPMNGESETVIGASFAELRAQGSLAVNVHLSAEEARTSASCGTVSF